MPPLEIRTQVDIAASREHVWQTLMDWAHYPEWNPFIVGLHGRHQRGARLVASIQPPGARRLTFRPVITALDENSQLVWQGKVLFAGLLDGEHHFELETLASGHVRLHHFERFSGVLLPLFSSALRKNTRDGFTLMNQALKQRCEALASPATA